MFETCMVESAGQLRSRNTKWTTGSAFLLEAVLLSLVLLATMAHTERLPIKLPHIAPPYAPVRATEIVSVERHGGGGGNGSVHTEVLTQPTFIPSGVSRLGSARDVAEGPPSGGPSVVGALPAGNDLSVLSRVPLTTVERAKPIRVSSGVQAARLLQQIKPVYPQIAKLSGVQGAVTLHAVVSRAGTIESLEVLSGHPMLTQAALDAVRQWRYRPTYLGDEPVEVETTIMVNFVLSK